MFPLHARSDARVLWRADGCSGKLRSTFGSMLASVRTCVRVCMRACVRACVWRACVCAAEAEVGVGGEASGPRGSRCRRRCANGAGVGRVGESVSVESGRCRRHSCRQLTGLAQRRRARYWNNTKHAGRVNDGPVAHTPSTASRYTRIG